MPRKRRVLEPNRVYHVFNRRTDRQRLFPSRRAYRDFLELLEEGRRRYDVRICSYCLMETHWHQSIWVRERDGATNVSKYLRWLECTHAVRFRCVSGTRGHGHVYQDRYQAVPVCTDWHYLILVRYIEANPLVAGLVRRAEDWPWSSLSERLKGNRSILDPGPVVLPDDWPELVNALQGRRSIPVGTEVGNLRDGGHRLKGRRSARAGTEVRPRRDGGRRAIATTSPTYRR